MKIAIAVGVRRTVSKFCGSPFSPMISPPHIILLFRMRSYLVCGIIFYFGSVAASLFAYFESVFKNQIQSSNILLACSFHLAKAEE